MSLVKVEQIFTRADGESILFKIVQAEAEKKMSQLQNKILMKRHIPRNVSEMQSFGWLLEYNAWLQSRGQSATPEAIREDVQSLVEEEQAVAHTFAGLIYCFMHPENEHIYKSTAPITAFDEEQLSSVSVDYTYRKMLDEFIPQFNSTTVINPLILQGETYHVIYKRFHDWLMEDPIVYGQVFAFMNGYDSQLAQKVVEASSDGFRPG